MRNSLPRPSLFLHPNGLELGFSEEADTIPLSLCCLGGTQHWARATQSHREIAQIIRASSLQDKIRNKTEHHAYSHKLEASEALQLGRSLQTPPGHLTQAFTILAVGVNLGPGLTAVCAFELPVGGVRPQTPRLQPSPPDPESPCLEPGKASSWF